MDSLERLMFLESAVLYTAAFFIGLGYVWIGRKPPTWLLWPVLWGAFVLQSIALWNRGLAIGSCPIGNPFEILQFVVWSLMIIYGIVGSVFRRSLLGFFTAGMAAGLSVFSVLYPALDAPGERLFGGDSRVEAHAALAIFSYGSFGLLALTSAMYLLQNFSLKRKRFEGFFRLLPSIFELERVNGRLLGAGSLMFSIAMLFGASAWLEPDLQVPVRKLFFALTAWFGYVVVWVLRSRQILLAGRLAWACLMLFFWSMATLVPVEQSRVAHPENPVDSQHVP